MKSVYIVEQLGYEDYKRYGCFNNIYKARNLLRELYIKKKEEYEHSEESFGGFRFYVEWKSENQFNIIFTDGNKNKSIENCFTISIENVH